MTEVPKSKTRGTWRWGHLSPDQGCSPRPTPSDPRSRWRTPPRVAPGESASRGGVVEANGFLPDRGGSSSSKEPEKTTPRARGGQRVAAVAQGEDRTSARLVVADRPEGRRGAGQAAEGVAA